VSLSPGGILPRDMNGRQFSEWARAQAALPHRDIQSFSPTWTGFSAAPAGSVFFIDMETHVIMWYEGGTGTSDADQMYFDGIPDAAQPEDNRDAGPVWCIENTSNRVLCMLTVTSAGRVVFGPLRATGTASGERIVSDGATWVTSGLKGPDLRATWLYAK
jgi:hypothetical protein